MIFKNIVKRVEAEDHTLVLYSNMLIVGSGLVYYTVTVDDKIVFMSPKRKEAAGVFKAFIIYFKSADTKGLDIIQQTLEFGKAQERAEQYIDFDVEPINEEQNAKFSPFSEPFNCNCEED